MYGILFISADMVCSPFRSCGFAASYRCDRSQAFRKQKPVPNVLGQEKSLLRCHPAWHQNDALSDAYYHMPALFTECHLRRPYARPKAFRFALRSPFGSGVPVRDPTVRGSLFRRFETYYSPSKVLYLITHMVPLNLLCVNSMRAKNCFVQLKIQRLVNPP